MLNLGAMFSNKWMDFLRTKRVGEIVGIEFQEIIGRTPFGGSVGMTSDDSANIITMGDEIFDLTYNLKTPGNDILIECLAVGIEQSNHSDEFHTSMFINNVSPCRVSTLAQVKATSGNNNGGVNQLQTKIVGSGESINVKIRAGMNNAGGWTLNERQRETGLALIDEGDTMNSWIKITEIQK